MKIKGNYFFTLREDSKDEESQIGNLLIRSGMLKKTGSGTYIYLPMGLKVLNNIKRIIKEEMDKLNIQELTLTNDNLLEEVTSLRAFKLKAERKDKEAMIASFYMLSDEDKQDVVENIDKYSLDDIEAKLSIICVRNKVNFNLEDENTEKKETVVFSLDNEEDDDTVTPAWVKAVQKVAKNKK